MGHIHMGSLERIAAVKGLIKADKTPTSPKAAAAPIMQSEPAQSPPAPVVNYVDRIVEIIVEKPIEVIKEIIKEVRVEVPVEIQIVKEVIKHIERQVPIEIEKIIEIPFITPVDRTPLWAWVVLAICGLETLFILSPLLNK